jgi:carboxypeptidase C (cathepsin A)
MMFKHRWLAVLVGLWASTGLCREADKASVEHADMPALTDQSSRTAHTMSYQGRPLAYVAEAGVLVVHSKDPLDEVAPAADKTEVPRVPHVSMSYVAYTLGKETDARRPIMFIFNGGPGSSTIWLHMGSFAPKRVVTTDAAHSPAAPYQVVDNSSTLLADSDLVFVDAPGTGFSHLRGQDAEKAFFGVDQDVAAFAGFIVNFLSSHGRWNSPKFIFGESYGTTRAAALAYRLQDHYAIDLNGVILLSQILSYDNNADTPQWNPGVDQPYALALPTYAATAWYHHALPDQPPALQPFLAEVEAFATGEYLTALAAGRLLGAERRTSIAARLHAYTGLSLDVINRANLRINAGVFEKNVLGDQSTAGRLDTRFTGVTLDPLSKEAEYDPQSAAISSAYVSAFNDYVRRELKFGEGQTYKFTGNFGNKWDYLHQPPSESMPVPQATNVMPDLANAMKQNPRLKVMMNGGYYDLATPYFAAEFELSHLAIPDSLANNLEIKLYPSGHMIYAHEPALVALSANVADFVKRATHVEASH